MIFIFHCRYPRLIFFHYSNYSLKALQCIFSSGHINKKIFTQVTILKKQIVTVIS